MALLFTHPCPLGPEQHCLGGPGARGATHSCQWSQEELHEGEMLTEAAGQPPELVVGPGRCPSGPGPAGLSEAMEGRVPVSSSWSGHCLHSLQGLGHRMCGAGRACFPSEALQETPSAGAMAASKRSWALLFLCCEGMTRGNLGHPSHGAGPGTLELCQPSTLQRSREGAGLAQVLEAELDSVSVPSDPQLSAPSAPPHSFASLSSVGGAGEALVLDHGLGHGGLRALQALKESGWGMESGPDSAPFLSYSRTGPAQHRGPPCPEAGPGALALVASPRLTSGGCRAQARRCGVSSPRESSS